MNTTIRRIAVSGSAAVALLGGAAAITTATAPQASAAEQKTAVHHVVTAPVNLPDGRTIRIAGLGGYGHAATDVHVATVAALKTDASPSASPDLTTGITPGAGTQLPNPVNGQQTGYNQQITTQAGGGTIAVGVVAIAILGLIVFFRVRHNHLKVGDAVVVTLLGVALSGTVIGALATQMTNSGVGSLGGILGGLG